MSHWLERFLFCPVCGSRSFAVDSEKSRRCGACGFELFMNASASTVAVITNHSGQILVVRRAKEPARGTLDLPGGFVDALETAEQGVCREVREETGLHVVKADYLFSIPNVYEYSGLRIPTEDLFFRCTVSDTAMLRPADDAAECLWLSPSELRPEDFGLTSIRQGIERLKKA